MDAGPVDMPVTLVIKASNQKYQDQTINCFLNWTVERLKHHLTIVYPSRPSSKDQRLVYSGQLLQDHVQLRDVLRKTDEEYHMMHLVCASHSPPRSPEPHSSAPSDAVDGLRHRGPAQYSCSGQGPGGPQGPLPGALPGALPGNMPPHPAYMQALWWQQMYARHYYLQYRAAVAASQNLPVPTSSSSPSPSPPPQPEPVAPPLDPQEGPPLNQHQVDQDRPDRDQQDRHWLSWLYTSRVGVLLSIVYFFSSFSRFLMVLGALLLVYLYQVGRHHVDWFPFRPEQPRAEQREAQRQHDMRQMERLMDEGLEQEEPEAPPPEAGFLLTSWAFLSSFFTSLIPDNRPQANH